MRQAGLSLVAGRGSANPADARLHGRRRQPKPSPERSNSAIRAATTTAAPTAPSATRPRAGSSAPTAQPARAIPDVVDGVPWQPARPAPYPMAHRDAGCVKEPRRMRRSPRPANASRRAASASSCATPSTTSAATLPHSAASGPRNSAATTPRARPGARPASMVTLSRSSMSGNARSTLHVDGDSAGRARYRERRSRPPA